MSHVGTAVPDTLVYDERRNGLILARKTRKQSLLSVISGRTPQRSALHPATSPWRMENQEKSRRTSSTTRITMAILLSPRERPRPPISVWLRCPARIPEQGIGWSVPQPRAVMARRPGLLQKNFKLLRTGRRACEGSGHNLQSGESRLLIFYFFFFFCPNRLTLGGGGDYRMSIVNTIRRSSVMATVVSLTVRFEYDMANKQVTL